MHITRQAAIISLDGAVLTAGCSASMPKVAPKVEPAKARWVLEATISAWKEGKAIGGVTDGAEPVVVQVFD